METGKALRLILLTALVAVSPLEAQEPHQHDHGESLGKVRFPISCAAAQQKFDRALALLHSFQYPDAAAAFAEITNSQPDCAIAWWGQAMSSYHPLWLPPTPAEFQKGQAAIARATVATNKTPRESDYVAALETFFRDADKRDHWERARAYCVSMERVSRRYPQDREAAIFYALALNGTAPASEKNLANRTKAAQILYRAWPNEPDHPGIAHYLIHSYDYPSLAHLALPAARRYAKVAPSSAHALHMPSHIFTRLGLWPDSIQSNLASAAAAKQQVARTQPGATSHDHLHALDYLMYAYLQGAEDDLAKSILTEAAGYSESDEPVFQVAFAWTAIPARFALERHQWKDAAALPLQPAKFPWDRFPFAEANVSFARAVGAARGGDPAGARLAVQRLVALQAVLSGARGGYDWAKQVEIQQMSSSAWLAQAEGNSSEAERLLRTAAELEDSTDKHPVTPGAILPAREMLGDLMLELKRPAQAITQYEAVLRTAPNRFNSLYGTAHAAELAGNRQKARLYYRKLTALCTRATGGRVELELAKKYLAKK